MRCGQSKEANLKTNNLKKRAKNAPTMVSIRGNADEVETWKRAASLSGTTYGRYIRTVLNEAAAVEIEAVRRLG